MYLLVRMFKKLTKVTEFELSITAIPCRISNVVDLEGVRISPLHERNSFTIFIDRYESICCIGYFKSSKLCTTQYANGFYFHLMSTCGTQPNHWLGIAPPTNDNLVHLTFTSVGGGQRDMYVIGSPHLKFNSVARKWRGMVTVEKVKVSCPWGESFTIWKIRRQKLASTTSYL